MNILSDNEYDYESRSNGKRRNSCCCTNSPEPGKALLACGSGGAGPIQLSATTSLTTPIPVASVSIDTRRMDHPKVLLMFNALISIPETATTTGTVTVNFMITKSTNNGCSKAIGGTFTFSKRITSTANTVESEAFSFQHCDCSPCPGCTTYTVEIAPSSSLSNASGLTITNATLTALAVEDLG